MFQDPRSYSKDERELVDGYFFWLWRYAWDWSADLRFSDPQSAPRANQMFSIWTRRLQQEDGTPVLRWVKIPVLTPNATIRKLCVLVGGLKSVKALRWMRLWQTLAGDACVQYYRPDNNALRYFLSSVNFEHRFKIEVHLPLSKPLSDEEDY